MGMQSSLQGAAMHAKMAAFKSTSSAWPVTHVHSLYCRFVDLLLLEVDEEVKEFVGTLKNWPLAWLIKDGRVLVGLTGAQAGEYYGQQVVRFYIAQRRRHGGYNSRQDWRPLPRHSLG